MAVNDGETLLSRSNPGAWLRELPPEHNGALTFHLPLYVEALEAVGVERRLIEERIEQYLPEAFASGLKDPPLYRWAQEAYRPLAADLLADDEATRLRAFASVAPLGEGLAGAAFHGLIRLGYGSLRRDRDEIARGLAYMRSRRQVLFAPTNPLGTGGPVLPRAENLDGMLIFDQLDLVAGSTGVLRPEDVTGPVPPVATLCAQAIDLMLARPDSFIAVHAVDALHALVEFERLVLGAGPLGDRTTGPFAGWWHAYVWSLRACAALVQLAPETTSDKPPQRFTTFAGMTSAAIDSCEAHDIKVVVALRRLAEFGIIEEGAAIEAGRAKISATECSL